MKWVVRNFISNLVLLSVLGLIFGACSATHTLTQDPKLIQMAANGNFHEASAAIQKLHDEKKYKDKDRVLYYLNQGMLQHYLGNYEESNNLLTTAERAMEDLYTKSISRAGASLLLNDNVLEYDGEDYEDIYLNVFKALNYLHLGDIDDAFVEINRVDYKLRQLTDKYVSVKKQYETSAKAQKKGTPPNAELGTIKFHNSVLARYLSMLLYLSDNRPDNAEIDRKKIGEAWMTQPKIYSHPMPSLDGQNNPEKSNLQIIAFTGLSPIKKKSDYYITTLPNALNVTSTEPEPFFATVPWIGMEPNYHFKFSLPYMAPNKTLVRKVVVKIDGQYAGELQLLENMEAVAMSTFAVKAPLIYFKTLSRTIIKGVIAAETKKEMDKKYIEKGEDPNADLGNVLAKIAIDAAVDMSESADLRTSMFFPGYASVGNFNVQPGSHEVKIDFIDAYGHVLSSELYSDIIIDRNNPFLIETYYLK